MEKTQVRAYGRIMMPQPEEKKGLAVKVTSVLKKIAFSLLGFFCGRATLFGMLNPLGLAYLSAFLLGEKEFIPIFLFTALGILTGRQTTSLPKYLLALVICMVFHLGLSGKGKKFTDLQKALLGGISIAFAGCAYAVANDMSKFLLFLSLAEGVMVFSLGFLMCRGIRIVKQDMVHKLLTSEEAASIAVILAGGVAGAAGISIGGIPIKMMLCSFIILVAGFRGGTGMGAATGVLTGFVLMAAKAADAPLFCAFSIAGLLGGCVHDLGKWAVFFAYTAALWLVSFYMSPEPLTTNFLVSSLLGGALYLALPKVIFTYINTAVSLERGWQESDFIQRFQNLTKEKMRMCSDAFYALSRTFLEIDKPPDGGGEEVDRFIDAITDKVCAKCGSKGYCWKANFYNTYQAVFALLSACERRGSAQIRDLPGALIENCSHASEILETVNQAYEVYKVDLLWRNKLSESRDLISQQLQGVSYTLEGLAQEVDKPISFLQGAEKLLLAAFRRSGIAVQEVSVYEENAIYHVSILHPMCLGKKQCAREILALVNKTLGRKMKRENSRCMIKGNVCSLDLIEECRLKVATAVATSIREGSPLSGDSYTFLEVKGVNYLLALSDGMGSGEPAQKESQAAIEMLERFVEAGFEQDFAIRMINSALLLKSGDEAFTTLDICNVNLYTGQGEFIKIGAACAYLVRQDLVRAIRSETLPVGVFRNVEVERESICLEPDDKIILVTDGVADIMEQDGDGEAWLTGVLQEFKSHNPQDTADHLLAQVKKKAGNQPDDDMTVLVARIWEK